MNHPKMEKKLPIKMIFTGLESRYKCKQKDLAQMLGYTQHTISRFITGENELNGKFTSALLERFPEINKSYLLKGIKPIFLDEVETPGTSTDLVAETPAIYETPHKTLKIFDLDVQAGAMPLFDDVSTEPSGSISFLGSEHCDFAVKVHGESMTGKIANGGIIAVKEIKDLDIIPFGHIFLIFTSDLRMVKYIKRSEKGEQWLKVCSHNSAQFEDFDIKRDKVIKLFIVKKIINDES